MIGQWVIGQGAMSTNIKRENTDIRKKFFTQKAVKHWKRLLRQVADAPILAVFKARLDKASSNLVSWQGGLGLDDL